MSWNARFGFFWYNDEEIFEFTEENFGKMQKSLLMPVSI